MGMEAPSGQMNVRVIEFLQELSASGTLGPDASASVESLLAGRQRPINVRVAEALVQAQKDGRFGPDATASIRTILTGTEYEDQL